MKMVAATGSLHKVYGIPKRIRDLFVTSHDIEPRWHVTIQAAFQKQTDNAVSKTVNFKNNATPKDVEEVFLYAHEMNCKGVTVYRDGSRSGQVITTGNGSTKAEAPEKTIIRIHPRPRPSVTHGRTYKTKTGCGNLYVNINADGQGLCEVFTQMGKSGGCAASNAEAVSRLVSIALRAGIDPQDVVEQLRGIRCPIPTWNEGEMILSCADAIGRVLERAIKDFPEAGGGAKQISYSSLDMGYCPQCPECGGIMEHESGCAVCKTCGFSKCG
jgi:ribonucleoside-diphosphate reductase alpha chain